LWIAARAIQAVALVAAPLYLRRRLNVYAVLVVCLVVTALPLVSIFYWRNFPACFVAGSGLTQFKIVSEYIICLVLLAALVLLLMHRERFDRGVLALLVVAIALTIPQELIFTEYRQVDDPLNALGHLVKLAATYLVYVALIRTSLTKPHYVLFRELAESRDALRESLAKSERYQNEVSALLQAARAVLTYRDFEGAARSIFDSCKGLLGATAGYVALLNASGDDNSIVFLESGGRPCTVDPKLPMPIRGLRQVAYETGKTVYDNSFARSQWAELMPAGHVRLDNVLFAPLKIHGAAVGLIGLANKPGGFSEDDARLATAFGELAAVALLNSRTLGSLQHSEERFRAVAETAADAIITVDVNGKVVLWNQGAEKMFGYPAAEMLGQPLTRVMPERYRQAHRDSLSRLAAGAQARLIGQTTELVGLRRDGAEFPLELSLAQWRTAEGVFFSGIVRDITEHRRAQHKMEILARFPNENPSPVLRIARQGEVLFANPAGSGLLEELGSGLGRPAPAAWRAAVEAALDSGRRQSLEVKCRARLFSLDVVPIADFDYVNLYGRDVTELRRAEGEREAVLQQLASEQARLKAIIDSAPEGIIVADREGRLVMANPAAERLFRSAVPYGPQASDPGGPRICRPDGRPYEPRERPLLRAAVDGEEQANVHVAIIWPDGERRDMLESAAPIRDPAGRPAGAVGIFQDISEEHRFRAELQQRAEQLETLIREAHHRIRNNLQSVISLLELERSEVDAASVGSLDRCVSRIRAIALVHRLLTTEATSSVSLQNLLKGLAELAEATYGGQEGRQIDIGVSGSNFTIPSRTATSLAIVVNELITNAMLHAFPERQHGRINVVVSGADGRVEIRVADNGRGCPPEVEQGTGLLLTRNIVEHDLGGEFRMSGAEQGCECVIKFPL